MICLDETGWVVLRCLVREDLSLGRLLYDTMFDGYVFEIPPKYVIACALQHS